MTDDRMMPALIPRFHAYLQSLHLARSTIERYTHEAHSFAEFSRNRHRLLPETVHQEDLEDWGHTMLLSGCRLVSMVTRMRALRAFFVYMLDSGIIPCDPFVGLALPALPATLPREVPSLAEVARLIRPPEAGTAAFCRNHLIFEVLYATGLRVGELCGLDVGDMDFRAGMVRVRHGKGGKQRVVPIGQKTAARLWRYLVRRSQGHPPGEAEPLFLTCRGRRITGLLVGAILRQACLDMAIRKHITPHSLRHACATHMHARGAGIFHIKEMLGHADVTTTQIYARVAPREVRHTHAMKHPRERYARALLRAGHALPGIPKGAVDPIVPASPRSAADARQPTYGAIPDGPGWDAETRHWVTAYQEHLRLLNRTGRTIQAHVARLSVFLHFARSLGATSCLEVSRPVVLQYREHLTGWISHRKPQPTAAVQNQYLAVVLSFFRFLAARNAITVNPVTRIRYARELRHLPRTALSPALVFQILEQPDLTTAIGIRDRAILEVLYSCGLRKSELVALSVGALNLEEGWVSVWAGKGGKDRVVPIGLIATRFVLLYLRRIRPSLAASTSSRSLFLSMRGRSLSKNVLLTLVRKYAARAGLEHLGVTPHSFRHACATHLVQNGAGLRHLQEFLGHSKISSTQTYVHLGIPDLKRVYHKTHPLG